MKTIRGKRALVTGAASGIGRAISLTLARQGADLYLLDLDDEKLAGVVAEAAQHGTRVAGRLCDLTRPDSIHAAVRSLLHSGPYLDILVNNAGVAYHGKTEQMSVAQWDWVLAVNLLAPIQLTRELLPTLLARPESHIVNVCSVLGLVAIPRFTAYQTSKFGLVGFSESLRAEYTCRGLGVTALCPGFVRTNMFQPRADGKHGKLMRRPPGWMYTSPERVAARVIKAIRRNQGLVPVAPLARFLWLVKRLTPGLWDFASRARIKKTRQSAGDPCVPPPGNATLVGSPAVSGPPPESRPLWLRTKD